MGVGVAANVLRASRGARAAAPVVRSAVKRRWKIVLEFMAGERGEGAE
jgi:hypothetical protein